MLSKRYNWIEEGPDHRRRSVGLRCVGAFTGVIFLPTSPTPFTCLLTLPKMKLQNFPRNCPITALTNEFHSARLPNSPQGPPQVKLCGEALTSKLLDRRWTLLNPDTKIHQIVVSAMHTQNQDDPLGNMLFTNNTSPSFGDSMMKKSSLQKSFYVVRDDLLHPLVNGNKARKLDALFPLVEDHSVTDVVTCGGCQSAHTAAIAVSCAERGIRSHLLLRGEQPAIPTGYNLISTLYGNVSYVPRSLYAKREEMLAKHADLIAGCHGSVVWLSDVLEASLTAEISGSPNCEQLDARRPFKRVFVVNEGAGDAVGLLGVIRLVKYLSQNHVFGREQPVKVVVDAGTGTTAIGLALGAICLGLPWEVYAIMLADNIDGYRNQEERLVSEFQRCYDFPFVDQVIFRESLQLHWLERSLPRKFGNVLPGEVKVCQQIAQETGILIDPIYTLASWELATRLSQREAHGGAQVVMLHTGGTLGMFGLAQRYKSQFDMLKGGACS